MTGCSTAASSGVTAGHAATGARVARLVVIGGGAAGMSAASAARRVAPDLDVVVCEAGGFAAYGMCGIPYYLGGMVPRGGETCSPTRPVSSATSAASTCGCTPGSARSTRPRTRCGPRGGGGADGGGPLGYDALVRGQRGRAGAAAGARAGRAAGVHHPVAGRGDRTAAAAGLRARSGGPSWSAPGTSAWRRRRPWSTRALEVEIVEALPRVLGNVDEPIAAVVQAELERHTRVRLGTRLDAVRDGRRASLTAVVDGAEIGTDLVVVATGVRPASDLLIQAGAGAPAGPVAAGRRGACAPRCRTCSRPVTASRCPTWCWAGRPGYRSGPRPTRPAGWRARSRPAAPRRSAGSWAPRWSRCSTSKWPAPG